MGAYHQMGHDSENLLFEPHAARFCGAILSPVNYGPQRTSEQVADIRLEKAGFDVIFDPQLYVPQSQRGQLPKWTYFPAAVDTADMTDLTWWRGVIAGVVGTASSFLPNAVCSPAYLPKVFTTDYYDQIVKIGAELSRQVKDLKFRPIQTFVVNVLELSETTRTLEIASIASKTKAREILLVFHTDVEPRRELADAEALRGAMILVRTLSRGGFKVLVGFCSSDMVLWKAAGASACATGKFFNLRRFSRTRWDEPSEGGQGLPYWFEENLLAFVREPDLVRLREQGKLSPASLANPVCAEIFAKLDALKGMAPGSKAPAWIGLGWRQYMHWFADAEHRIQKGLSVAALLQQAERNWLALEDERFFMSEPRNEGKWLRPWRRAEAEYQRF